MIRPARSEDAAAVAEMWLRRQPAGLQLWTFQVNEPARRFYAGHGFVEAERTDGSRNEEREPDVRYVWRPSAGRPLGVTPSRSSPVPGAQRSPADPRRG